LKIGNCTDTSGNPPASKVYRAAKIMLSQKNVDGYYGSGSGVASQEQVNSARGLVKAFREDRLNVPAVIRLGGNMEDEAVEILSKYSSDLPFQVEGYKKDDPADYCAERLRIRINDSKKENVKLESKEYTSRALIENAESPYEFKSMTGRVLFDHSLCLNCQTKICIEVCTPEILELEREKPVLAITENEAAKGKCTECLACELECYFHGNKGCYVELPIAGLKEYRSENLSV